MGIMFYPSYMKLLSYQQYFLDGGSLYRPKQIPKVFKQILVLTLASSEAFSESQPLTEWIPRKKRKLIIPISYSFKEDRSLYLNRFMFISFVHLVNFTIKIYTLYLAFN